MVECLRFTDGTYVVLGARYCQIEETYGVKVEASAPTMYEQSRWGLITDGELLAWEQDQKATDQARREAQERRDYERLKGKYGGV
jgi:hypothetical protein